MKRTIETDVHMNRSARKEGVDTKFTYHIEPVRKVRRT
jgi:hypothetical protein